MKSRGLPMVLRAALFASTISLLLFLSAGEQASQIPAASECKEKSRVFLARPSKAGLTALSELGDTACWVEFESSNTNVDKLNNLVERGNRWGAQYLAAHVSQLDGGNSEDALIALGKFSDHDMERLLVFAKDGLLSKYAFDHAVTMLPLPLSDDSLAQLKSLSTRRSKVLRIARKDLLEQKREALTAIDEFAAEVKSDMSKK